MTDKELLEKAAKAAGIDFQLDDDGLLLWVDVGFLLPYSHKVWNPLTDDGDALRLAVYLGLLSHPSIPHEQAIAKFTNGKCLHAATRRAITRAAAAMVKE